MFSPEILSLAVVAAGVGLLHTLVGPDHYIPFVAMAKARRWSRARTLTVTFLCGLGHVLSSVVLGLLGVALGWAVGRLEVFESARGDLAAWALTAFGLVYMLWGIRQAIRNRPHVHPHRHPDATEHTHDHNHHGQHAHVHTSPAAVSITPWVLFTIFVLGPCEPLIPILMYPAATAGVAGCVLVAGVFAIVTIATMMLAVLALTLSLNLLPLARLERWSHALAGGALLTCGLAIHLGL